MKKIVFILSAIVLFSCNPTKNNDDSSRQQADTVPDVEESAEIKAPEDFGKFISDNNIEYLGMLLTKKVSPNKDSVLIFSADALTETNIKSKFYLGVRQFIRKNSVYAETASFDMDTVREYDGNDFNMQFIPFSMSVEDIDNDRIPDISFLYFQNAPKPAESDAFFPYRIKMLVITADNRYEISGLATDDSYPNDIKVANNIDRLNLPAEIEAYAQNKWWKYAHQNLCDQAVHDFSKSDILDEPAQTVLGFLSFYFTIKDDWFKMTKNSDIEQKTLFFSLYLNAGHFLTENANSEITARYKERITDFKKQVLGEETEPYEVDMLFHLLEGAPQNLKELSDYIQPDKVIVSKINDTRQLIQIKDLITVETVRKNNAYFIDKIKN